LVLAVEVLERGWGDSDDEYGVLSATAQAARPSDDAELLG
jgi:hypothetical protein